jgi:hypothetical protein
MPFQHQQGAASGQYSDSEINLRREYSAPLLFGEMEMGEGSNEIVGLPLHGGGARQQHPHHRSPQYGSFGFVQQENNGQHSLDAMSNGLKDLLGVRRD